jgi:hypothetical protein
MVPSAFHKVLKRITAQTCGSKEAGNAAPLPPPPVWLCQKRHHEDHRRWFLSFGAMKPKMQAAETRDPPTAPQGLASH